MKKILHLFRFRLFRIVFVALVITGGILFYQYRQDTENPSCHDCNLILISVDTLRADHMGVYGYDKNTTPNIDKWAKGAMVFDKAYTIFPLTFQSFYTLFEGRNSVLKEKKLQDSTSVTKIPNPKNITLPQILKKEGFRTAAFTTNPVIGVLSKNVFRKGFDNFFYYDETQLSKTMGKENAGKLFIPIFKEDFANGEKVSNDSINWLKENANKGRFFLWTHYSNPHEPYMPPIENVCSLYKDRCPTITPDVSVANSIPRCITPTRISSQEINELKKLYDGEILSVDEQIGRFLDYIKKSNLDKNTVVIFYSDHGESFEHNILSHGYSLYEPDVHIPMIISSPKIKAQKNAQLIDNSDILPSLLTILNVNYNEQELTGKSFFTSKSKIKKTNKDVFFMTLLDWTGKYGVTNGEYKYIYSNNNVCLSEGKKEELYMISSHVDNKELNNITDKEQQIYSNLKSKLFGFFELKKEVKSAPNQEVLKSLGY
ncbi:MAG: sulfatase [Candidatus Levybacteria bacterium]|nr:sulfatase [Candidatus Levybacteria bacterium]